MLYKINSIKCTFPYFDLPKSQNTDYRLITPGLNSFIDICSKFPPQNNRQTRITEIYM